MPRLALTRRDHVRAVLITVALLVYGIAASPMPRSIKRAQFDEPIAVEELDRWVDILAGVGLSVTRPQLANGLFGVGDAFSSVRNGLLGPFKPWFRVSGTGQGWGLFTYPDSYPHQLVVEVKRGGEWDVVFAGLDPDATWMRDTLAYRRVRGLYDGNTRKPGGSYQRFVDWIGGLALTEFPDAKAARVGFVRTHSLMPGEPPDPERTPRHQRVVER